MNITNTRLTEPARGANRPTGRGFTDPESSGEGPLDVLCRSAESFGGRIASRALVGGAGLTAGFLLGAKVVSTIPGLVPASFAVGGAFGAAAIGGIAGFALAKTLCSHAAKLGEWVGEKVGLSKSAGNLAGRLAALAGASVLVGTVLPAAVGTFLIGGAALSFLNSAATDARAYAQEKLRAPQDSRLTP